MESKTEKVAAKPAATITTTPTPLPAPTHRRLHPAAIRLAAIAVLLAGWLGYLAFLVVKMPHRSSGEPLILSRPQPAARRPTQGSRALTGPESAPDSVPPPTGPGLESSHPSRPRRPGFDWPCEGQQH